MEIDPKQLEMMKHCLNDFREDLAKSLSAQKERSELKTKYIDVLSHQFRTPLTGMRLNLEVMLDMDEGLDKSHREMLTVVHEETVKLIHILNDIVLAQEIENKGLSLMKKEENVAALLRAVLKELEHLIEKKSLKMNLDLSPELTLCVFDMHKMHEVILHLVKNAVYYSPENAEIQLLLKPEGSGFYFQVTDLGIGIPLKDQAFIFERFFRAENAMKMFTDSSGLGLYIAKHFVEAHGGEFKFKSAEDEGSMFSFSIA